MLDRTGDLEFVRQYWNATYKLVQYAEAFINPETQLWAPPSVFKGAPNGTASSAQFVWTWKNLAKVATALSEYDISTQMQTQANRTAQAVSEMLWNEEAGLYNVSTTDGNFSYIDGKLHMYIICREARLTLSTCARFQLSRDDHSSRNQSRQPDV